MSLADSIKRTVEGALSFPMESTRIPFKIAKAYAGCAKVEGILIVGTDALVLEYKVSDRWWGAISTGILRKGIGYSDLDRAEFRLGFFKPHIVLTARSLSAFEKIPTADNATLRLGVSLKYWRRLRSIVSQINFYASFNEADRYRDRLNGF